MKGEAIARVRQQQGIVLKNQIVTAQKEAIQQMHAMNRAMYPYWQKDYAGTYGGTVEPKKPKKAIWYWWA